MLAICLFAYLCYYVFFFFFFFFSSRRRHTRCLSDWSSDVCSSDLPELLGSAAMRDLMAGMRAHYSVIIVDSPPLGAGIDPRSEERRVGKECRSRWWRYA